MLIATVDGSSRFYILVKFQFSYIIVSSIFQNWLWLNEFGMFFWRYNDVYFSNYQEFERRKKKF